MNTRSYTPADNRSGDWPGNPIAVGVLLMVIIALALVLALAPITRTLVLLGAVAVVLAVLLRPWVGLPLLAVAIPFAAIRPLPLDGAALDGADLLLGLIIAAWLAQGVVRRHIVIPNAALLVPMVIFLGTLAFSLVGAVSFREGLTELLKWIEFLALYLCVVAILPAKHAVWLLAGLLIAGVGQAVLGLYQFITQTGPEQFILMGKFMRAYGTFRQPNPYAGYLGLIAPLALSLAFWAWLTTGSRKASGAILGHVPARAWLRVLLSGAALLTSLGLLVSWSRGAWLAFAAATVVVVLAWSRRAAPVVLIAGGLAFFAALVAGLFDLMPASLLERLGDLQTYLGLLDVSRVEVTDANFAVIERIAHWQAALRMWAEHPWLGVGVGNYATAYPAYALPRWNDPLGHAHNVYLNFGAEAGLVGLSAYFVLWVAALWRALRLAAHQDRLLAAAGAGILGVLTQATIHNLFDNLWVQHMYLHLALLLGLLTVMSQKQQHLSHPSSTAEIARRRPQMTGT